MSVARLALVALHAVSVAGWTSIFDVGTTFRHDAGPLSKAAKQIEGRATFLVKTAHAGNFGSRTGLRTFGLSLRALASRAASDQSGKPEGSMLYSAYSDVIGGEVQVHDELAQGNEGLVRSLRFSNNPKEWQSAIRMIPSKDGTGLIPDWNDILFHSIKGLALGCALVASAAPAPTAAAASAAATPAAAPPPPRLARRILLIGLGGGALAGWFLANVPGLEALTACELDPAVLDASRRYFGLPVGADPRLTVHATDGLAYAAAAAARGEHYDLVVVDASAVGGGGPPAAFTAPAGAAALAAAVAPGGALAVNVLCDSDLLLNRTMAALAAAFPAGGGCYLENRDASHSWRRSAGNKVAFFFQSAAAAGEEGMGAAEMARRAEVLERLAPAAAGLGLGERVRAEHTTLARLRGRARQLEVFARNHAAAPAVAEAVAAVDPVAVPGGGGNATQLEAFRRANGGVSAAAPSAAAAAAAAAKEAQLKVYRRIHVAVPALAGEDTAPTAEEDSAKLQQLEIYRRNNPGVDDRWRRSGIGGGGMQAPFSRHVAGFGQASFFRPPPAAAPAAAGKGSAAAAANPCNRVCRYKKDFMNGQVCIGCFRDQVEISRWGAMSEEDRRYALADSDDRRREWEATGGGGGA